MKKVMLTTVDNPHDPFDNYSAWHAFDIASHYFTESFLGRILYDSDQLSDSDIDVEIENTIDEIVKENVSGIYRKVVREID